MSLAQMQFWTGRRKEMSKDYCQNCGCPPDVCCGRGKVSLKEHQKYLDAGAGLKLRVIELEMEVERLRKQAKKESE